MVKDQSYIQPTQRSTASLLRSLAEVRVASFSNLSASAPSGVVLLVLVVAFLILASCGRPDVQHEATTPEARREAPLGARLLRNRQRSSARKETL